MSIDQELIKEYEKPAIEVIELELESNVAGLPASGLGDPS